LPHAYYARQDTINEIEDYYVRGTSQSHDYRHLSGAEIVYYPNRQEYRIWNHARAVNADDLSQDDARSIIASNCRYLEDRWKITINPIIVCYKNESKFVNNFRISTWENSNKPKLPIYNSPIPEQVYDHIKKNNNEVEFPKVLADLKYNSDDIDYDNWLDTSPNGA
jgi:hypothetical protein